MLLLRHNQLSCHDLFIIERKMIKVTELSEEKLNLMNLKVFEYSRPNLYGLLLGLFQRLHLCEPLGITTSQLLDFIISVDQGYMMNHYHSFFHAADVTMILYHILCQYEVAKYLSRVDIAAVLISGLCHDIGHPGKNNNFQVNTKSELACRYSDKSVLESYSCTLTMDLMTQHKLLANIEEASNGCSIKTTESEFRTNVIKMILATDMIFHFELQESLNNLVELSDDLSMNNALASVKDIFTSQGEKSAISYFRQKSYFDAEVPCHFESILPVSPGKEKINEETEEEEEGGGEFLIADNQNVMFHEPEEIKPFEREKNKCMMDSQYRLLLCEIIVHAADISNPVRPWPICHAWADLVAEEFFGQGDAEKELGLSVSPNMDRNKISKGIIGMQFSEFIIRPFFETFSEMFPKASVLLTNVQDNYDHWVELEKGEKMNQQDEEGGGHCYPTSMLPNRPMLNPPGRRVSVAAGMIIIPDQKPSNYLIPRSASHIDLAEFDQFKRKQKELHCRRKSEQPRMSLPEVSSRRTPIGQKY